MTDETTLPGRPDGEAPPPRASRPLPCTPRIPSVPLEGTRA